MSIRASRHSVRNLKDGDIFTLSFPIVGQESFLLDAGGCSGKDFHLDTKVEALNIPLVQVPLPPKEVEHEGMWNGFYRDVFHR